jgi:hypothetical protein
MQFKTPSQIGWVVIIHQTVPKAVRRHFVNTRDCKVDRIVIRVLARHVNMATRLTAGIVCNADLLTLGNGGINAYGRCHMNVDCKIPIAAFDLNVVRGYTLARTSRIALGRRAVSCSLCHDCPALGRTDIRTVTSRDAAIVGRIGKDYVLRAVRRTISHMIEELAYPVSAEIIGRGEGGMAQGIGSQIPQPSR